ncbi:hypothetical protein HYDPIDRAFT_31270 [Hydnomerulius pinastri MD-312]|uniref:C2H2-type domain-containing protein n=1 Tax=Hydnomerulius pinastri MD-312 TaxID=994086 RepID=A0A0C9W4J1_9AGAM|nr:hypothetical protein HYDPIDRAFT_31270 [Hydnomerulius pinastri MD-312]
MPLCLICPTGSQPSFAEISDLATHISQMHYKGPANSVYQSKPPGKPLVSSTQCSVCNKKFTSPGGLTSHQQAKGHYLPCSTCSLKFTTPEQLARHQSDVHRSSSSSSNGVKGHSLTNGRALAEAPTTRRGGESEQRIDSPGKPEKRQAAHSAFPCSKCSRSFPSLIEWNTHFKQDHQKIQCSACNAVFTSEAILASHAKYCPATTRAASSQSQGNKSVSSGSQTNGQVACDLCDQRFNVQEGLQAHVAAKHSAAAKCGICRLVCSSPSALENHVNTIHSCAVCQDGILRDSKTLADHAMEHSHPVRCKKCGTRYRSEEERAVHFGAPDNDHPFCVRCRAGFEDETALSTHTKLAHPPTPKPSPKPSPPRYFKCEHCPQQFPLQTVLEAHVAAKHFPIFECETDLDVHIVTVHSCPICHDGIYMDMKALEDHLEEHRAPYRCVPCGTAYKEEGQLLQHYKEAPNDIHPVCAKCDIGFETSDSYTAKPIHALLVIHVTAHSSINMNLPRTTQFRGSIPFAISVVLASEISSTSPM